MYAKRIIPCLDLKNGRVVKGTNFVNLRDAGDPVEAAVEYDRQNADELVLLDITASSDARNIMVDIVSRVANSIFIPFTVGGGIRTVEDFTAILRAGADKVSVNSAALKNPRIIEEAAYKFGSQCVVVAMDAKRRPGGGWTLYLNGGRVDTGLRPRADARRLGIGRHTGDRLGRRGQPRALPGCIRRGQGRCGARRIPVPFPGDCDPGAQGLSGGKRHTGAQKLKAKRRLHLGPALSF